MFDVGLWKFKCGTEAGQTQAFTSWSILCFQPWLCGPRPCCQLLLILVARLPSTTEVNCLSHKEKGEGDGTENFGAVVWDHSKVSSILPAGSKNCRGLHLIDLEREGVYGGDEGSREKRRRSNKKKYRPYALHRANTYTSIWGWGQVVDLLSHTYIISCSLIRKITVFPPPPKWISFRKKWV